jgi:hypothetical protein
MPYYLTISLLSFTLIFSSCKQAKKEDLKYLAQKPPTLMPQKFAPDLISQDSISEFGSVFNAQGTQFYFGVEEQGKSSIYFTELRDTSWTEPVRLLTHPEYSYNDPFLSNDEKRLYYISNQAFKANGPSKDIDIWYSKKAGDVWSAPIPAGPEINSEREEYYISFTAAGSIYYASNIAAKEDNRSDFDIYESAFIDGQFQTAKVLSDSINTAAYEADVFVAPDAAYLIFCATRRSGLGRGDLYISFKNTEGNWQKAVNMGAPINTEGHELCPFVTKDGKYFFYTSRQDIYWVDAQILEQYRP